MSCDSKDILINVPAASCTNTHHDITDSVNHGMDKNTKTWISRERNITFLWNQNILNLCGRWDILRSYRFVAEVTFKDNINNHNKIDVIIVFPYHKVEVLQCNVKPFGIQNCMLKITIKFSVFSPK